jgi:hypothetical protein
MSGYYYNKLQKYMNKLEGGSNPVSLRRITKELESYKKEKNEFSEITLFKTIFDQLIERKTFV